MVKNGRNNTERGSQSDVDLGNARASVSSTGHALITRGGFSDYWYNTVKNNN